MDGPWWKVGFGLLVTGVGALMIWRNLAARAALDPHKLEGPERDFRRRQLRRRIQASAMIVIVGLAIQLGIFVTAPVVFIVYWLCVVLLVFWIVLLSLADMISIGAYYRRERKQQLDQYVDDMRVEMRRQKRIESPRADDENGKDQ